MKRKLHCNKGSTMILLLMAVGIISLLGTSVLGVTMMNYKIKRANTELKSAFYMSEIGLDQAYERAYQLMLEAVNEGNKEAQIFINNVTSEITTLNKEIHSTPPIVNTLYKDYIEVLLYEPYIAVPKTENIKSETIEVFNKKFELYLSSARVQENLDSHFKPYDTTWVEVESCSWDNSEGGEPARELTVKISSTYNADYTKKTAVDLVIEIPEYSEPFDIETKIVPVHKLWTYGLAAENLIINGNLDAYDENSFSIIGNAYFRSNVEINGRNIGVNFKETLVAAGGNIDNSGILIKGQGSTVKVNDIYTKNIIMTGTDTSFKTDTDRDYEIYVKDDLEMNSIRQKVNINGSYYGFGPGGERHETNTLNSAIIINSSDIASGGSSLNISKDLILYGTSYIKNTPYATGESISMPGNYIAYTQSLSGGTSDGKSIAWDNIETVYYDPLPPLAHKFISQNSYLWVWNKADYFIKYNEEYSGNGLNLGGGNINIGGNIRTLGLGISGRDIVPSAFSPSFLGEISENKFKINYDNAVEPYESKFSEVASRINSNLINSVVNNEVVYIGNGDITINDGYFEGKKIANGIIVTKGNIVVNGEFDFRGTMIANGNITINQSLNKKVNIVYDINYLTKLIAKYGLHNTLFSGGDAATYSVTVYKSGSLEQIDFKDSIGFKNWKLRAN